MVGKERGDEEREVETKLGSCLLAALADDLEEDTMEEWTGRLVGRELDEERAEMGLRAAGDGREEGGEELHPGLAGLVGGEELALDGVAESEARVLGAVLDQLRHHFQVQAAGVVRQRGAVLELQQLRDRLQIAAGRHRQVLREQLKEASRGVVGEQ